MKEKLYVRVKICRMTTNVFGDYGIKYFVPGESLSVVNGVYGKSIETFEFTYDESFRLYTCVDKYNNLLILQKDLKFVGVHGYWREIGRQAYSTLRVFDISSKDYSKNKYTLIKNHYNVMKKEIQRLENRISIENKLHEDYKEFILRGNQSLREEKENNKK
jgi:hypothetical protein